MPNLSIKDVPEAMAESLRQRARRHHRSLQGELMAILESALADGSVAASAASGAVAAMAVPGEVQTRGTRSVAEAAADLRRRFAAPLPAGPLAVDILRQERDAR